MLDAKVKSIGKSAFLNCSKLSSVVIKTKLLTKSSVGASAFKGIYKKAVVTVPSSKLKDYTGFLFKKGVPKTAKFTK